MAHKIKCRHEGCEEGHYCYGYHPAEYVTMDMAIDAGDRSMAGELYRQEEYEWGACPCCEGDYLDCKHCLPEKCLNCEDRKSVV